MSKENRKFSVPYNNSDPEDYIARVLKPFLSNIENVFLSPVFLAANHLGSQIVPVYDTSRISGINANAFLNDLYEKEENTKKFMKLSKDLTKRIITLNAGHYNFSDIEMKTFVYSQLKPLVEDYEIDGFICTDFNMARYIHKMWPHLELHTSCNCFQWNVRQMHIWQDEAGISVFNPPREILRTPGKLKEMHDEGFKLKCICNEACLYGCPNTVNHCMNYAMGSKLFEGMCDRGNPVNFFRANWVIPRWLSRLDFYVYCYKIAGRNCPTGYISNTLKAYVEEDDTVNLLDIVIGGTANKMFQKLRKIPVKFIHDKLLYCECKECGKTCFKCEDLYEKLLKEKRVKM